MSWRSWTVALSAVLTACSSSGESAPPSTASTVAPVTTASTTATTMASTTAELAPVTTASPTSAAPPATPATTAATTPPTTGVAPEGFDVVAGRVSAADGSTCDVCLWLAADVAARARGLMGVTDLSGADGMVFAWDEPTTGVFWMRDTPQPLSIAFFAADGSFVSATDMEPCLAPTPDAACARYPATGPYVHAVEVAQGGLTALLIGPGSRLDLYDEPCPLAS